MRMGEEAMDTMKKWTPKKQWTRQRHGRFEGVVVAGELVGEEARAGKTRKKWPSMEDTKKKVTEEEEKFIKEITDFNDEYEITKKRDIVRQENIKKEISDLEKQANVLRGVLKDEEIEAIYTTKYLEAEKTKVKEKPQHDAECLR
ncbi:UPF0628 protein C10orf96-like [Cricetulus griseus]|uniref:Coiled-coil domain-containing protein 172 n=1 Tax=Cricetulus griseus TaxID=10029 RepID=G3IEW8_CRIGR|nr:UPF0628 protein C10orf96-like [Cricetulus griseus]